MNEQEKFLQDLIPDSNKDVLNEPIVEPEAAEPEETSEETELRLKNRRERRLGEKLQREREANIALNARLQGISEAKEVRESTEEANYLTLVERIYGNATPEAKEATEILKKALQGVHNSAKEEALTEAVRAFEQERESESEAVKKEEDNLDEMMESLEDDFGADFSDPNTRKGFLTLLEKVSPKDRDGNIIEYADPETTYELYESRKEKSASRAKELAGRSMTRSGASPESKLSEDSALRVLKEAGII